MREGEKENEEDGSQEEGDNDGRIGMWMSKEWKMKRRKRIRIRWMIKK